ncbi:conserved membrane hypothetical protein [[Clostridium] ultunense Esp]|nr:conserved membrane hypothetical protein [[Clostridium] ultunense Esp]
MLERLVILAFIGFVAQLVDGSLGMAYGLTSTSFLLMFGIAPAAASASVHLAEVITTATSGLSHLKFGNVDRGIVSGIVLPGSIGAFLGALFLGSIPGELVKPYASILLFALGLFILIRFLRRPVHRRTLPHEEPSQNFSKKGLIPLGFIAGFIDSTGGGGWGPITTPVLLARKNAEARKVVGSVDTSEFAVALSATLGFLISLGWQQVHWEWVIAIMAGGMIAAPIAAWLVRIIPSHFLGILVGGMILVTNARTILTSYPVDSHMIPWVYGLLFCLLGGAVTYSMIRLKKAKKKIQFQGK